MTNLHNFIHDLIDFWEEDTGMMSYHDPSHPVWEILRKMAKYHRHEVIIAILRYCLMDESWIFLVLFTIVDPHDQPSVTEDECKVENCFMKMSFDNMREMWLNWGREKGYLEPA